mgnify:CR=1 FL=1
MLLLILGTSGIAQYASTRRGKVSLHLNYSQQEKRTIQCLVVGTALFILSDYYMRTRNEGMYRVTRNSFIVASVPMAIYVWNGDTKKNRRSYKY